MNTLANLLDNIVRFGRGEKYVKLQNTVGHCYYFPYRHIRAYTSLFQPSSLKGSIVVLLLPFLKRFKPLLPYVRAKIATMEFDKDFLDVLEECFGYEDVECALFCGTPGRHAKPTMLVASGKKTVGYCKVSESEEVIELFKTEKKALEYLHDKGVKNAPEITLCAPYVKSPSLWLFCQTTQRKRKVKIPQIGSREVIGFVEELQEKTSIDAELADTDFCRVLDELETLMPLLEDKKQMEIVRKTVAEVRDKLSDGKHRYAASHGDLTPWNSFIVEGHLFAFDLEYFKQAYPPYADLFHFFTQSLIYDYYADAALIREKYQKCKKTWLSNIPECDFHYRCYLLSIIWFYLNRDKGISNARLADNFRIWTSLLESLESLGMNHKIVNKIREGARAILLSLTRKYH